jgi:hypothetical protein
MYSINAGQIGPIQKINNEIYTAEAIAPTGEIMYLAMEAIEKSDSKKWISYRDTAALMVNGGCWGYDIGSLTQLGTRIHNEIEFSEFLNSKKHSNFWTADPQKFELLCAKLRNRKISVDSSVAKELAYIPHASNGMNVLRQTHVVYVSKVPVAGRINLTSDSKGFAGCVDSSGNLIMSVGVTINEVVENRGIFRNPLSVVEGGYGGISMMIHSFTCKVVKENFPEVKVFRVRPLKKMAELFLRSLPIDQITVNGMRADLYAGGFEREQDVRVPIEILSNLHTSS